MAPLRLGTRGSALALAQARIVADGLGEAEIVEIRTSGDEGPGGRTGGREPGGDKARFVNEIETALLEGEVDIGVHSAKDLPAELPATLAIGGVPRRGSPLDAYVGTPSSLAELPQGARIGTSSLRRRAQLLAIRPDLDVVELRGNVDTRLNRLADGDFDGLLLAAAGLERLGRGEETAFELPAEQITPAAGQGALALEVRIDDGDARAAATSITDPLALAELNAERAAIAALGASCNTPVGVLARISGSGMTVRGFAGLPDGSEWVRDEIEREASDPSGAGLELAARMKGAGADDILERAEAGA